jgi:hypothetical protein
MVLVPLQIEAAPVKARPPAGIGVFCVPDHSAEQTSLVIYREPGIGRILATEITGLPYRQQNAAGAYSCLPVIARRHGWLKIIYDDAERDGWTENRNDWYFLRWEEFLAGRPIALFKGLRKDYYQSRREPQVSAELLESLAPQQPIDVLEVAGGWLLVATGGRKLGWLRWYDDNGRLLVHSLPAAN